MINRLTLGINRSIFNIKKNSHSLQLYRLYCTTTTKNKPVNIFDDSWDDDEDDQDGQDGLEHKKKDTSKRVFKDLENREPIQTKRTTVKIQSTFLTEEDIIKIMRHENEKGKSNNINIFDDDEDDDKGTTAIKVEKLQKIATKEKETKVDMIAKLIQQQENRKNEHVSNLDLSDEGFELLVRDLFKNKRTGEYDLDEEDIIDLKRMIYSGNYSDTPMNSFSVKENDDHK
ncbi:hypothetical protein CYY_008077 [Polysphondylium violaceum]|uniref:Uncharacterized protein n=1 Tax=Polysphondylium violaceum TaxID=133409 RepID=A0A8J4PW32_9MYCE|nr:hypothetical protein CYY_008077 [Polysphondylium violaceum]